MIPASSGRCGNSGLWWRVKGTVPIAHRLSTVVEHDKCGPSDGLSRRSTFPDPLLLLLAYINRKAVLLIASSEGAA
jgi:hypothetical protein